MESKPLPPCSGLGIERCDNDGETGGFLVELNGGGQDVGSERSSDPPA